MTSDASGVRRNDKGELLPGTASIIPDATPRRNVRLLDGAKL